MAASRASASPIDDSTVAAVSAIVPAICARLALELAPPSLDYVPFEVDDAIVGWIATQRLERLASFGDVFTVGSHRIGFVDALADREQRTAALHKVVRVLADEGRLSAWRGERFAVAPDLEAPALFDIERAAARYFGVHTAATHVNGLVDRDGETRMWLARRSLTKAIDPDLLDNLVGGGVAAGFSVRETMLKEAWEEAGIANEIAGEAQSYGTVHICREQARGLQRETVFVFDLHLPVDFVPANQDGEASEHRIVSLGDAARIIAVDSGRDQITADASLVILDCLMRHGVITPASAGAESHSRLDALRRPSMMPTARRDSGSRPSRTPR